MAICFPQGWGQAFDPQGVPYYYDKATQQSQYEHPQTQMTVPCWGATTGQPGKVDSQCHAIAALAPQSETSKLS